MSKKIYKKRKQAAHTKKKAPRNEPKATPVWDFINNWLWLITLVVIVAITALMIIFIPACDSCEACQSCDAKWAEITSCESKSDDDTDNDTDITDEYAGDVSASDVEQFQLPDEGETIAVLETSMGTIKLRLFPDRAPKTVENFTTLIKNGYYDGVTFHRVINDFMIQSGDPTGTGAGGESAWGGTFEDEFDNGLYNFRGALSMANTGAADSNSSQFFIVQSDSSYFSEAELTGYGMPAWAAHIYQEVGGYCYGDHVLYDYTSYNGHTVFGQVFEGMDVVDAIAGVEVVDTTYYKPAEDVIITRAYLETYTANAQ